MAQYCITYRIHLFLKSNKETGVRNIYRIFYYRRFVLIEGYHFIHISRLSKSSSSTLSLYCFRDARMSLLDPALMRVNVLLYMLVSLLSLSLSLSISLSLSLSLSLSVNAADSAPFVASSLCTFITCTTTRIPYRVHGSSDIFYSQEKFAQRRNVSESIF